MSSSIRRFSGWSFQRFDLLIERIAKHLRHIVVEAKPGNDGCLLLQFPISGCSVPVARQAYDVLAAPVTARGNAVNHQFRTTGQIDKDGAVLVLGTHRSIPPTSLGMMHSRVAGVER